jgi:hypothetical protein
MAVTTVSPFFFSFQIRNNIKYKTIYYFSIIFNLTISDLQSLLWLLHLNPGIYAFTATFPIDVVLCT